MHGLRQIVKMNDEQQAFIDHILSNPTPDVNLLQVWREWKQSGQEKFNEAKKLGEATI
jgi:hypothetical protein